MIAAEPQYDVGYKRPPKASQFKPGQRGNPKGRPRGSPNKRTVVERTLDKKISVRKGNKTSKVSVLEAMTETFALKAAQGDRHAAAVVINLATKTGVFCGSREDSTSSPGPEPIAMARDMRPSDKLVESLDDNLLSNDEKIELSQLAERIDFAGDIIALGDDDLLRFKQIVNKGRGKNVEPQADGDFDQAA